MNIVEQVLSMKANIRRGLKNWHTEKIHTCSYMKHEKSYTRLDSMRGHIKTHDRMAESKRMSTYTMREASPKAYKLMKIT